MPEMYLLHCCCAPCGIAVIDELRREYALTVFFYNPNIFPEDEYLRRKREVVRVCGEWGVPMIDADYAPAVWDEAVRGHEDEPEGGLRCQACVGMRLERTAREAAARGFDRFGTTLTMGRQKRATLITPAGEQAARMAGVPFHAEDWKKHGREEKARHMVTARGIYRQNYCGCRFSRDRRFDFD
jgi:epoxyqueuosine reductase